MTESEMEISRITIIRTIDQDGRDGIAVESCKPDGEPLMMIETLGLLEFAKAHLIAPMVLDAPEDE
ncbi:hypothetical protein IM25_21345 [Rhodococcus sp. p52]|uniref:hypothetical protein n=1 Tax=Rhodococcus sp. p52 TaxID=935199 RepID=UPI00051A27B5|nr:hypothetical protein [Rhodococcus sp. p52]AOD23812.1 hypothetical protein IM25_21345 [Rhodococcus sp. p52]